MVVILKVANYVLIDNLTGISYKVGDFVNVKTDTNYYKQARINRIEEGHISINDISINLSEILYLYKIERQQ